MLRCRVASILDRGIDGERREGLSSPFGGGESAIKNEPGLSSWRATEYGYENSSRKSAESRASSRHRRARGCRCGFLLPAIAGDYVNARRVTTST